MATFREVFISTALKLLPGFDRLLMRSATTPEYQVFPNETFPWVPYLEANWETIRDEAQGILEDRMAVPSVREVSVDHEKIAVDGKWRSFFLWGYGVRIEKNLARAPKTAAILENIPGLLTAFYSVMLAGAHVPKHTGPTKAIVTTHLGLIIPKNREACHMAVGDNNDIVWQEGKVAIFDDMFPHQVWNDTNEDRIILLLHIKRPLKFPGTVFRDLFFTALRASPFVKDGLKNLDQWDKAKDAAAQISLPDRVEAA